jgi:GT2 family glycosyltransferase
VSRTKLFVAVPTTNGIVDSQVHAMRELENKYKDKIEFVYPEKSVRRIFHDFARNEMVKEFLSTDCDLMWFLDSDICPPNNVLDLITEHGDKWKVAGAPYPVFMVPAGERDPAVLFCVYKDSEKGMSPKDIPYDGVEFVDGLATGCMFIKREVFEKLEKPYFEFKFDPETRHMTEGEDIGFCKKVLKLGYKFFTDYSMVCKHYKNVCLLEVNNYTINYANNSVKRYDALIKAQIGELKLQSKPKSNLILPSRF